MRFHLLSISALALAAFAVGAGPYDIELFPTPKAPDAKGEARLLFADSPFGVATTADGHAVYDVKVTLQGLPSVSSLGGYTAYVAWAATPELNQWTRLGTVTNGTSIVGKAEYNKFLLVIAAESTATPAKHAGPIVLHGTSPSGWLQSFLSHPLFRNGSP
jgi:hypothetical protein